MLTHSRQLHQCCSNQDAKMFIDFVPQTSSRPFPPKPSHLLVSVVKDLFTMVTTIFESFFVKCLHAKTLVVTGQEQ